VHNFKKRLQCVLAVCKDLAVAFHLLAMIISAILLMISSASAHAQGGVPLWTNRYDGGSPAGIAVDSSGNVFVTGGLLNGTNSDFVTIKYSNAGVLLWTNGYNGPGNSDAPSGIAIDASGNVFVAGISWNAGDCDSVTIKYSNAGVPLWTNRYHASSSYGWGSAAIAVDTNGNAFVTGNSDDHDQGDDFFTIAYSDSGLPLWTNGYHGPASRANFPAAIAVDRDGNVFVTGSSDVPPFDYATIKYSNTGQPLWKNLYDGPAHGNDYGSAIAVDGGGDAFVTGGSGGVAGFDLATIKYSNAGVPLWTNRYRTDGGISANMAVDRDGNVFVTGDSLASNGSEDFATIKYSNAGLLLWTRRYNGPGNSSDIPSGGIAVDSAGNVFVTGRSINRNINYDERFFDYATVAYSNTGVPLWTNRYDGPANSEDRPSAIAVDSSGSVFVTGFSRNTNGYSDIVTIKYSSSIPLPRLDFQTLNNALVLSWTNAGFNLQTAPAVTGPFTNLPAATSPYTNSLTGGQQFFGLASP
jgi:beta-propeller repeat-containing protein